MNAQTIPSDDSLAEPRPFKYERLLSLDALRGFDMFWIIGGQDIVKGLAQVFPGKLSELAVGQLARIIRETRARGVLVGEVGAKGLLAVL